MPAEQTTQTEKTTENSCCESHNGNSQSSTTTDSGCCLATVDPKELALTINVVLQPAIDPPDGWRAARFNCVAGICFLHFLLNDATTKLFLQVYERTARYIHII